MLINNFILKHVYKDGVTDITIAHIMTYTYINLCKRVLKLIFRQIGNELWNTITKPNTEIPNTKKNYY